MPSATSIAPCGGGEPTGRARGSSILSGLRVPCFRRPRAGANHETTSSRLAADGGRGHRRGRSHRVGLVGHDRLIRLGWHAGAGGIAAVDHRAEGDPDRAARPAVSGGQRLPRAVLSCATSSSCGPTAGSSASARPTGARDVTTALRRGRKDRGRPERVRLPEVRPGIAGAGHGCYAAIEMACLDACARATGRRLCELVGGPVRDSVEFAAYLFFRYAADHPVILSDPHLVDPRGRGDRRSTPGARSARPRRWPRWPRSSATAGAFGSSSSRAASWPRTSSATA